MKIKAAILYEPKSDLVVEDVELGDPRADEVLVRIMATGLCHSDLHVVTGDMQVPLPVVLGHEGAGIVETVGGSVTRVKVGDHVALSWAPECGECRYCITGRPNLCTTSARKVLDGTLLDGTSRLSTSEGDELKHFSFLSTFAESAVVPEASCVPIDHDVPFAPASLVGCAVMTGIGAAMNNAKVRPGSNVVVYGAGGVGLNVIQGAAICGAEKIVVIDVNQDKESVARNFGATHFVNPRETDIGEAIGELTDGFGADYVFEAIGLLDTMSEAYDITARGGTVVYIGIAPDGSKLQLPAVHVPREEKVVTGSFYGGARPLIDFPAILRLYKQGKVKLDELVSERVPLERINAELGKVHSGEAIRVVVEPNA